MHGDDDQIVPIGASAMLSAKLVKGSTLKVYPGLSHGMCTVNKDQINADLLAFIKSLRKSTRGEEAGGSTSRLPAYSPIDGR